MIRIRIIISLFVLFFPLSLMALESVSVDESFNKKIIGAHFEYIEDKGRILTFEQATREASWEKSKKESMNFGFTRSVYWFRFSIDNTVHAPMVLFFEISYPLLNHVEFYMPNDGEYKVFKTGNKYPFIKRDIEDRNFIFQLQQASGPHTYYLKVETSSSLNFIPILMSQKAYITRSQSQLPLFWIYYGLMFIMLMYNLFIFLFTRDRSYVYYVLFIASYILFQMTLNGFSFQYLWPNAVWWGCNSLPIFMCTSLAFCAMFLREILDMRWHFRTMNRIILYGIVPAMLTWAVACLFVEYGWAIRVATFLIGVTCVTLFCIILITIFKKSRSARFIMAGFAGIAFGIVTYVLKTFGFLPEMFITEWAIQVGSTIVVLFLSLALADKINVMRRELKVLLTVQQENEQVAQDRADYLEGVVGTATGLSEEFIKVSGQLQEITQRFSSLSMEQAGTSEEMSSTFEELSASVDTIYQSTIHQKDEGEKSMKLVDELNKAQKGLIQESQKVEDTIKSILRSASDTGESLQKMTDTMNIINTGGKEISQFIAMIDDISDRINLLSLNAAIEAARAGDYGRGFAVVADEIGKLAQATSDNSKEIARQISKIITDIDSGTRIVTGTKESTDIIFSMVNGIGTGINSVRELMLKQNQALEMVISQAGIIETMSKDIMVSTNEQKNSMAQTQTTITRLAEMGQEISQANNMIIDFTKVIYDKARQLDIVVRKKAIS